MAPSYHRGQILFGFRLEFQLVSASSVPGTLLVVVVAFVKAVWLTNFVSSAKGLPGVRDRVRKQQEPIRGACWDTGAQVYTHTI